MAFIATLLALAALGAASLLLGIGLLVIAGVRWLVTRLGWGKAWKVARELRELETGTCDGYPARMITAVVEECWIPSKRR